MKLFEFSVFKHRNPHTFCFTVNAILRNKFDAMLVALSARHIFTLANMRCRHMSKR